MKKLTPALFMLCLLAACKKETPVDVQCPACPLIGNYTGQFHQIGGPYGAQPPTDTVYTGVIAVDTLPGDSIAITVSVVNTITHWAYTDTGYYYRHFNLNDSESFTFSNNDSLYFFRNLGGSGGYFRTEFAGKKN